MREGPRSRKLRSAFISAFSRAAGLIAGNRLVLKAYEWFLLGAVRKGRAVPEHIGVILDGNRRWASSRGLEPWEGHREGAKKVEDFLGWCLEFDGIRAITLYVLSTENFKRPREELEKLLEITKEYFERAASDERIHKHRVRIKAIGRLDMLPEDVREAIRKAEEATKDYGDRYLNIAIAYGGRAEIVDAVRKAVRDVLDGRLSPDQLDERAIEERLYTSYLPNPYPDLIIRTSGEERLSNFLLWQSAYSELCFMDVYWPSFRKIDLLRAIRLYQQRSRRFGA